MPKLNKTFLINDLKKIPSLIIGLFFLSLGITILRLSGNGLDAWGVFHEGISLYSGVSFGTISVMVGFAILFISLFFKIMPGIGTLLNIILVGPLIDVLFNLLSPFQTNKLILLFVGFYIVNFGRALYISSDLGAGPRDALYVGMTRLMKVKVSFTKPTIELVVTIIGFLFGGTVGIGLVILTLLSGKMIDIFFNILKYNPVNKESSSLISYFSI